MGFTEAIRVVMFEKYATFSGRAPRSEFWWFVLFYIIVSLIFRYLLVVLSENLPFSPYGAIYFIIIASALFQVFFFLPAIAVTVRRLHDRNLNGLLAIAPVVLSIVSLLSSFFVLLPQYFLVSLVQNTQLMLIIGGIYWFFVIMCLVIIVIAILKGTNGSNAYGPDPLQSRIDAHIFE